MTSADDPECTGPELFTQAISHLRDVHQPPSVPWGPKHDEKYLKIAQVYATLAQTAAIVLLAEITADAADINYRIGSDLYAWRKAIPRPGDRRED